jgi:hypothetical protein
MKKLSALLLALAMVIALAACGGTTTPSESTSTPNSSVSSAAPSESDSDADAEGGDLTEAGDGDTSAAVSGETVGQTILADFQAKMADGTNRTAEELANELLNNDIIPFSPAVMAVEPGYLSGFNNAEITGFADGAMFAPMIGSIPFVGYIFVLEDGTDVDAFVSNLKDNADLAWNICVEADEMVCEAEGNTVFFLMCPAQFEE